MEAAEDEHIDNEDTESEDGLAGDEVTGASAKARGVRGDRPSVTWWLAVSVRRCGAG